MRDIRPLPKVERARGQDRPRRAPIRRIFDEFRKANARKFRGFDAPEANVQAIEAAVAKPYAEGVLDERRLFMELMTGTQARAQQYFFFAERKAAKIEGLPEDTKPRDDQASRRDRRRHDGRRHLDELPVSAGIPVTIVEMAQEALDRGTGVMRKNYEASAAKGRMTADQVAGAMGLLTPTLKLEDLADCDLIIEAVFENMDVKKEIFGKLDKIAKPGAILASNTSYLNIDEIAASTSRPQDVVGLHFFSPANVMKLLEVVRGAKTAPDVLVTAMQLAKRIRKVAVVAGVCHGFIGNRMLMPRQIEATKLLLEGATPEQIDRVHVEFGMPMGPFQMADLAGVDIGWHRDPSRIENIRDALCAADRWGQKKGAGFYDYDEKQEAHPLPRRRRDHRGFPRQGGRREARDQRRGDRRADALHDGQRGRPDPRGRHGPARVRHRCGLGLRLWLAGLSRRADVLGRHRRARQDRRRPGAARLRGGEAAPRESGGGREVHPVTELDHGADPQLLSVGHDSFRTRGSPWIQSVVSGLEREPECRLCGVASWSAPGDIEVRLESGKGNMWADVLGCGAYPFFIVSEPVLRAWGDEGIGAFPHHRVLIAPPYPKKLRDLTPPDYYWLDGSRMRGALLDFDASGFVAVRFCPHCGNRTDDVGATYDRQRSARWPYAFVPGSWTGTRIFTTDISPTKFFCTRDVLDSAARHKFTNFRFVPTEDSNMPGSAGIKYL